MTIRLSDKERMAYTQYCIDLYQSLEGGKLDLLACDFWHKSLSAYKGKMLRQFSRSEINALRRLSGVYFLWGAQGVEYIGKSINMYSRFIQHPIYRMKRRFVVGIIPLENERDLYVLERFCISAFQPVRNITYNRRKDLNASIAA